MSDHSVAIEARYMRRVQVGQFEPAEAEVKTTFVTTDMDVEGRTDAALAAVRRSVERVLGLGAPSRSPVTPATPIAGDASVPAPETSSAPKRVGRPTKAETEAKAAAKVLADAALAKASTDPMADMIETPAISKGDDTPREPPAEVDDMGLPIVAEPKGEAKPITDIELQNEAGKTVQRTGNSNAVRALIKTYADRVADVPAEARAELVAKLKSMTRDGKVAV